MAETPTSVLSAAGLGRACRGGGRGEGGQRQGGEQQRERQRRAGDGAALDDGGDALLHAALAKGRAQRQGTRAHLLQPQEGAGVGAAALAGGGAQGLFVAGELEIAVGERQHHPDERIEPVQAGSDGQRRLEERVEAAHVGQFVAEHAIERLAVGEVKARGQEDDGTQQAVGQRRVDGGAEAQAQPPAQGMTGEPLAGKTVLARRGGAEAAQAARVEGNKEDEQQRRHRAVDDGPDGRRGAFGACRGGLRGCLRRGRGARRSGLCGGRGGLRRGGGRGDDGGERLPSPALHSREQAQRRRGKNGQQQAHKRQHPQRAQQPTGQALGKQRPQNGDDEDQRAAGKAHGEKRGHVPFPLFAFFCLYTTIVV